MAVTSKAELESREADSDLSAKQYYILKISADDKVDIVTSSGDVPYGILLNEPDADGKAAAVCIGGTCEVECGGTITQGQFVGCDSAGKAVAKTTDGDHVIGVAINDGASGSRCQIRVRQFMRGA